MKRFGRLRAGSWLGLGLVGAVAIVGCDRAIADLLAPGRLLPSASPSATPTVSPTATPSAAPSPTPSASPTVAPSSDPSARLTVQLSPVLLVLNVPSEAPCPCPYESTGRFQVTGAAGEGGMGWSVADEAVATVGQDGLITARATGRTVVTVSTSGGAATASLHVVDRGGQVNVTLE